MCEFLTPSPQVRAGLGWGKKFTTPARIAILKGVSEKENCDVPLQVLFSYQGIQNFIEIGMSKKTSYLLFS